MSFIDKKKVFDKTVMEHEYPYNYEKGILWSDEIDTQNMQDMQKKKSVNSTHSTNVPSKNALSTDKHDKRLYKNRFDILLDQTF